MKKLSTRKILSFYMILFLITIVASVVIAMYFSYRLKFSKETPGQKFEYCYAMVTTERESDFWKTVYEGANESGREKDVIVELVGDGLSEDYSAEEMMEIAIASGYDGIIVYADESEEMGRLIDEAVNKGIPVVTVYGDNSQSQRCCYVGVGSFSLGREYGKQIVKMVREKETAENMLSTHANEEVNVIVLVDSFTEDSSQNILWSGIQNAVDTDDTIQSKINLKMEYVDNRNAFTVEESIRDIFKSGDNPDVIVCLNETNTACVYQAVVDYNKVGITNILGYYDSSTILKGISRNVIYSTVSVDTRQMGTYCVNALYEYCETGNTSQYLTTDVTLIDRSNVDDYLSQKEDEE